MTLAVCPLSGGLESLSLSAVRRTFRRCLCYVSVLSPGPLQSAGWDSHPRALQAREEPSQGGLKTAEGGPRARREGAAVTSVDHPWSRVTGHL